MAVPCDVHPRMEPAVPRPSEPTAPKAAWPKTCRCGEIWSRSEWPELPPIGRYLAGSDGWIELRTCVCGATMVVAAGDLERSGDSPDIAPTASS
jgi:hypothetical protein